MSFNPRKIELTENAWAVLEKRYLRPVSDGRRVETPAEMFERVARAVSLAENKGRGVWAERFYELMATRRFLPNSPTLMNAGKSDAQLSACFVLPVEDSLGGIFETLKDAAMIHQSGGGTGFSFSRLRAKGSIVRSSHGVASGPVSFMRIFDTATETIKQGGTRRGANMAVLCVDHPDVLEFIDCKRDMRSIVNFNLSVGVTDEFMVALETGGKFAIRDPQTRKEVGSLDAKLLFDRLVRSAWECGDPGLVFLDRMNLFNPTPQVGEMESTNPCGEQPLLPFESCNLGSLNLGLYLRGKSAELDWERLQADIGTAVRFLDNVVDVNCYPVVECERITLKNRKIGLGVMGFADLLLKVGLPYGSVEARALGERVMSFIDREAKAASMRLALQRGEFPNWKGSMWKKLGYAPMRNATVSTVAPTGTISMIAGASSGIEPVFSAVFYRNVLSGQRLQDTHPALREIFAMKGLSVEGITDEKASEVLGKAWSPAQSVSVADHVEMQAVFQRFSDSAVSKTINLPQSATEDDVKHAYLLAYRKGCKGITVYRDKSRPAQVLERESPESERDSPKTEGAYCPSC